MRRNSLAWNRKAQKFGVRSEFDVFKEQNEREQNYSEVKFKSFSRPDCASCL